MKFDLALRGLSVDLETLVDTRLLIQANSGGGKSWCIRRLLEQTHGQVQHLVIDPEGEFASLRKKFDYVLAAKSGGDTAADPRVARLLAERLLELNASAILDIYELKAHERIAFVRDFIDALVDAPKKLWHRALVVVDEAHVFCPERGGREAASAASVIDLATRGRKRGFAAVLATQRLSKLHKDAAAECNNKLIGRTGLDLDVKRAADELGLDKDRSYDLRRLQPGEFFAYGPAFARRSTAQAAPARGGEIRTVTIGAVETSHPRTGARASVPPPPSEAIRGLLPKLSDLPAEQAERQQTEADLRRELTETKRLLRETKQAKPEPKPAPRAPMAKIGPAVKEADIKRLEKAAARIEKHATLVRESCGYVDLQVKKLREDLSKPRAVKVDSYTIGEGPIRLVEAARLPMPAAAQRVADGINGLGTAERAFLTVLAHRHYAGKTTKRNQLAVMAKYSAKSRHVDNTLGSLRTKGYVVGDREALTITEEGFKVLGTVASMPQGRELGDYWVREMGAAGGTMLRVLLLAYPNTMTRDQLAENSGYSPTSRHVDNTIGALRTRELITGSRDALQASKDLI